MRYRDMMYPSLAPTKLSSVPVDNGTQLNGLSTF